MRNLDPLGQLLGGAAVLFAMACASVGAHVLGGVLPHDAAVPAVAPPRPPILGVASRELSETEREMNVRRSALRGVEHRSPFERTLDSEVAAPVRPGFPSVVVRAIMTKSDGAVAIVNTGSVRVGDFLEGTHWVVDAIDGDKGVVSFRQVKTGERIDRALR